MRGYQFSGCRDQSNWIGEMEEMILKREKKSARYTMDDRIHVTGELVRCNFPCSRHVSLSGGRRKETYHASARNDRKSDQEEDERR